MAKLKKELAKAQKEAALPHRRRLPAERTAVTHKFDIAGHEGYITVGLYPDGQPGEIFLKMAKEGSTVSGLMDSFATTVSVALQYGVPLRDLVNKFAHVRFEPSGFTGNQEIPIAKSIVDYIFRWLGSRFLSTDEKAALGLIDRSARQRIDPAPEPPAAARPGGGSVPAVVTALIRQSTQGAQSRGLRGGGSSNRLGGPTCHESGSAPERPRFSAAGVRGRGSSPGRARGHRQ